MIDFVGDRLPVFTKEQSDLLKNSYDFFGINNYATWYIKNEKKNYDNKHDSGYHEDRQIKVTATGPDGLLIGPVAASPWLHVVPSGMYYVLKWIDNRYNHPKIFITENGCDVPGESEMSLQDALNDNFRFIKFYTYYIYNSINFMIYILIYLCKY